MEDVGGNMWEVDQDLVMSLEKRATRKVWAEIWKAMDPSDRKHSQIVQVDVPEIQGAFHRQILWEAMTELEGKNFIRRWGGIKGDRWARIMVNPKVVHPYWMKGAALSETVKMFNHGPIKIIKLETEEN